ncbi:hypothetical protein HY029_06285 [Candidatus Gottesmanbacteria bacterium]|nr:hypothetical protein [Candidatus Gottesmanbacteria bacterium]
MTLSLVFYFVITVLSKRSTKNILHLVYGILPVVFASGLTLLIAYFQSQAGFPWNQWRTWEINMWNTSALLNKEFFLIFGLLPILSIPAVIYVLASFRFENIFILFWAIFPYLLLPFASLLGFGKVRLVNEAPYVPFAILYTFTLFHLTSGWQKLGRLFWRIGLIAIFLISIKPQLIPPLQAKINWTKGEMAGYTNIYLPKSMMVTINYLNKVELKNSVVLGDSRIGNFLPGYAPVRSFIGHPVLTKDYDRKNAELANFLRGSLTNSEANTFLKNNRISFIYFGQFEKEYGLKYLPYSSLIPEVETSDYILYKVI